MRLLAFASPVILFLMLAPASPPTEPAPPAPLVRVIVRVNRDLEVRGYTEFEDRDVIVVRTLDQSIESFPKTRIIGIVRLVDPRPGQTGVVVLRNGQRRAGIILEDTFDHVLLEVEGIRAKLVRQAVDYVLLQLTFEERYAQLKESLLTQPTHRYLELCRWLVEEHRYELAHQELVELLDKEPLAEAQRLLTLVEAQLDLTQPSDDLEDVDVPMTDPDDPDQDLSPLPHRLLTRQEINLIRIYEISLGSPPKVAVTPSTIRKLIAAYGTSKLIPEPQVDRNALFRADAINIVRLMFELRARELYPEIQVITEPRSLNLFRRRVHNTWLMNNCATRRCHGGVDAGRFFLHRRRSKDPRVRYANLLILERLQLDPEWPLVNYDDPPMSLIIQYGLPRHLARKPHPEVRGWKPVFVRRNARMLQDTVRWIDSMMQPRPDYPVEYQPPDLGAP